MPEPPNIEDSYELDANVRGLQMSLLPALHDSNKTQALSAP